MDDAHGFCKALIFGRNSEACQNMSRTSIFWVPSISKPMPSCPLARKPVHPAKVTHQMLLAVYKWGHPGHCRAVRAKRILDQRVQPQVFKVPS